MCGRWRTFPTQLRQFGYSEKATTTKNWRKFGNLIFYYFLPFHVSTHPRFFSDDVNSILWCTYRKGFSPLGSPQYTSDKGFGCMLRCGQMLLSEALKQIHLGRDWRWTKDSRDENYLKILSRFEDNKTAVYGIHQIALMGEDSGKTIGEWFSPNIIAQVIK